MAGGTLVAGDWGADETALAGGLWDTAVGHFDDMQEGRGIDGGEWAEIS
jgi:hypothetical protein